MWDSILLHVEKRKLLLIQTVGSAVLVVVDSEAECERVTYKQDGNVGACSLSSQSGR